MLASSHVTCPPLVMVRIGGCGAPPDPPRILGTVIFGNACIGGIGVGEGVGGGVGIGVGLGVGEGVATGLGVGVGSANGEGLGLGEAVGVAVADGLGVAVGDPPLEQPGESRATTLRVATTNNSRLIHPFCPTILLHAVFKYCLSDIISR